MSTVIEGTAGDDILVGGWFDDRISGLDGNDLLSAGKGNDTLIGGRGDDTLDGGSDKGGDGYGGYPNSDTAAYTGAVTDYSISYNFATSTLTIADKTAGRDGTDLVKEIEFFSFGGTVKTVTEVLELVNAGNQNPIGTEGNDTLDAKGGDDTITGLGGEDVLSGGAGNDILLGGAGGDTLIGDSGDDLLDGGAGVDWVKFNSSADITVNLATGTATGDGNDTLKAIENVRGGSGNDTLTGDANANTIEGGDGNDSLDGSSGHDTLEGGEGNDYLYGGGGDDWLQGGNGDDYQYGGLGDDYISDQDGVGVLDGGDGNDYLSGYGARGIYTLIGGRGDDSIFGGKGTDQLRGGEGNDRLDGEAGIDIALYSGVRSDFQVTVSRDGFTVTALTQSAIDSDGKVDSLQEIERIQFGAGSGSLALDMAPGQSGANAVLMVGALFGVSGLSNPQLMSNALAFFDSKASFLEGCEVLLSAGVIAGIVGSNSERALVSLLFQNIMGTQPLDAIEQISASVGTGPGQQTPAQLLVAAASLDLTQSLVNLVGLAQTGLVYG